MNVNFAINTGSLSRNTPVAVAQAKALGFAALEVNLQQSELRYDFDRQPDFDFYDALAQEIRLRGIQVLSVCNVSLTAAQVFSQGARREILQAAARVTARLGSSVLVVHPADVFASEEALTAYLSDDSKEQGELPLIAGFDHVRSELDQLQVRLALENVDHWRDTLLTNQAENMRALAEALDCLVCLDVQRSLDRPNLERWVELVGQRVAVLHLYDQVDDRDHHPPLEPAWIKWVALLKGTAAEACIIEANSTPTASGSIRASHDYLARLWGEE